MKHILSIINNKVSQGFFPVKFIVYFLQRDSDSILFPLLREGKIWFNFAYIAKVVISYFTFSACNQKTSESRRL